MKNTLVFAFLAATCLLEGNQSISGNMPYYLDACQIAAEDDEGFQNFRRSYYYQVVVESTDHGVGVQFNNYIQTLSAQFLQHMTGFEKLDAIGNPVKYNYPVGNFSPTTLRYISIAGHIKRLFKLPPNAKIAEIGAGFGGQCYILSQIHPFDQYYIFDLPVVSRMIKRVMDTLEVQNVSYPDISEPFEKIDLLISNYAFSTCDREAQLLYFENVMKKADRGYVIYNQISHIFGIDSLSVKEFYELLQKNNMHPKAAREAVPTHSDNILITWDRTKY